MYTLATHNVWLPLRAVRKVGASLRLLGFLAIGLAAGCAAENPLILAAYKGDAEQVNMLLEKGADVNARNNPGAMTALMASASARRSTVRGDVEIAKVLIAHGADVNATANFGYTALFYADDNREFVDLLLAHGANVNARTDGGVTTLMEAALFEHPAVVKTLLQHGADPNAHDRRGKTALMRAASNKHVEIVTMLLTAGADANARDAEGKTALWWVYRDWRGVISDDMTGPSVRVRQIVQLLQDAGAKE